MIYLDHASTSLPRHPAAIEAAVRVASWPTPGRGSSHNVNEDQDQDSDSLLATARRAIADRFGSSAQVCFTSGATAALNQAIAGVRPRHRLAAIDPLLHNAAYRPVVAHRYDVWTLPSAKRTGVIDVSAARREWKSDTGVVVVTHASNVTGALQPVAEIVALAHERGAIVIVDAAQTMGLFDDMRAPPPPPNGSLSSFGIGDADLVAFSAHKALRALPGSGALVVRNPNLELEPLIVGGTGFDSLSAEMPRDLPERLEAGTPNLPGIAAMHAGVLASGSDGDGWLTCGQRLREAVMRADVHVLGGDSSSSSSPFVPITSFVVSGVDALEVADLLDRAFSISCRAGLHCAPNAHAALGSEASAGGAVRVSASLATTDDELATLTAAIQASKRLRNAAGLGVAAS